LTANTEGERRAAAAAAVAYNTLC